MNRLILETTDFISEEIALISGSRAKHLLEVCGLEKGDPVKVGILNGAIGEGHVIESDSGNIKIRFSENSDSVANEPLPISVLLALPRPQMLKRIYQKAATFGIKRLVLFRSKRVEKSYFHSPVLRPEEIKKNLLLGLEQGGQTYLPEVLVFPDHIAFKDWRGENLSEIKFILALNSQSTLADFDIVNSKTQKLVSLDFLIGPEGGFLPEEEEKFVAEGFNPIKVSDSILRVESAFDFIMAQYSLMRLRTSYG